MSSQADTILVENFTLYDDAQVVVIKPQGGAPFAIREEAAVAQYLDLEKKLKSGAELSEPIMIGDKACALAPSLTVDTISGPIFWEEIVSSLEAPKK